MLFNLRVGKLEDLEPIGEGGLCGLSIREVIGYLAIGECLLDIIIVEIYYRIAITPDLSPNSISKNNLFFSVFVDSLDFSIMTDDFFYQFGLFLDLAVILRQELQVILVLIIIFILGRVLLFLSLAHRSLDDVNILMFLFLQLLLSLLIVLFDLLLLSDWVVMVTI